MGALPPEFANTMMKFSPPSEAFRMRSSGLDGDRINGRNIYLQMPTLGTAEYKFNSAELERLIYDDLLHDPAP